LRFKEFQTSRGALLLTLSQGIAIFVGFAIHVGLTRLLSPEFYGLYAVTISVLMWGELLITGTIGTAFPKALSEGSVSAREIWRWTWQVYLPLWLVLWFLFSAASWGIASLLRDVRLMPLLLVAASELPFFGIYIAARSSLQGLMAYGWMSVLSSLWALLRLFIIFAFVFATQSVLGVMVGNTVAVAITALLAIAILRPFLKTGSVRSDFGSAGASPSQAHRTDFGSAGAEPSEAHRTPISLLVGIGLPTLAITLLDQILLVLDLWILKRVSAPEFSGFYGAARFFAFALLMLALGLYGAWFPAMCHELGKGERERAKALLREAMRVLILGLFPFAVIVWATARPLSVLLFSGSFEPTAEPMRWLVIAISLFTFMGFMRGALIADNKFRLPVILGVMMTALDFLLCYLLIPRYGMLGAAWATTVTSAFGLIAMWVPTALRFGDFVPIATLARVAIASFVLWLIAVFWSASGLILLVQYLLLGVVYILALIALGELKSSDWQVLRVTIGSIVADVTTVLRIRR